MYSPSQLVYKYLKYWAKASSGKGHGIHSPFVFDFVTKVLNSNIYFKVYDEIEPLRKKLLKDNHVITIEDFGAGSRVISTNQRSIQQIARNSLKPKKYSQLLYRMVRYYQPSIILELGTSLGITTSYLAKGNPGAKVITLEGASAIAATAKQNFQSLSLNNIKVVEGNFDETLSSTLQNLKVDLAYMDGNHRYLPTIEYFHQILQHSHNSTIIILDDIHWSKEMEQAWEWVKAHRQVTLTIDLFAIGIVVLRKEILQKQHFSIRL